MGATSPAARRDDEQIDESPQEVVRALLGRPICDDEGNALLPAPRAYLFPDGPMTRGALLGFWAVSIVPAPDLDVEANRRAYVEAVERERPRIDRALQACAAFDRASETARRAVRDPRCSEAGKSRCAATWKDARLARAGVLGPVLEIGLRDRLGLYLSGLHRTAFDWLSARAPRAQGLAVCEQCSIVFTPAAKAHAHRCPACYRSPRRAPPLTARRDERGVSTIALLAGAVARSSSCAVCGHSFDLDRAHKTECSAACKQRRKRRLKDGRPIRDAREPTWLDYETPPQALRLARCVDCGSEYGTADDEDSLCPLCEDTAAGHQVYRGRWVDRSQEGWCGTRRPPDLPVRDRG